MTKDQRRSLTKKALLDALVICLKDQDFNEITTIRLVQTAGISRSSFYTHYKDKFIEEVNEFFAEFGTVISIQYGHSRYGRLINTTETWVESNNEDDKLFSTSNEVNLFLVSNKNKAEGEDEMYCRGNAFTVVYVDFKRERQELTLKSGKTVASTRIVGLQYNLNNWLHRDKGSPYESLDELIQNNKQMQQRIVALSV